MVLGRMMIGMGGGDMWMMVVVVVHIEWETVRACLRKRMFGKEKNERGQKLKYNTNHPMDVSVSAEDAETRVRPSTLTFLAIF